MKADIRKTLIFSDIYILILIQKIVLEDKIEIMNLTEFPKNQILKNS